MACCIFGTFISTHKFRLMTPVRRPRARRARPLVSRPSHPYLTPHGTPYPPSTYLLVPCAFGLCQSTVHPNGEPIQRAERRERTSWGMPGRVRNKLSVCLAAHARETESESGGAGDAPLVGRPLRLPQVVTITGGRPFGTGAHKLLVPAPSRHLFTHGSWHMHRAGNLSCVAHAARCPRPSCISFPPR